MTIVSGTQTAEVAAFPQGGGTASWFAVVGFDGTKPSQAALDVATARIQDLGGQLELVYVGHVPACASMSPEAILGIRQSFPAIAHELFASVHARLGDREAGWHFQQRAGSVAMELLAAATELRRRHGAGPTIVIIIGSSRHRLHHAVWSVAATLMHERGFPLLMVPPIEDDVSRLEAAIIPWSPRSSERNDRHGWSSESPR